MLESGIYGIFSKIDNKIYVGSAVNFLKRKKTHFDKLKTNVHVNKPMQNFSNKYGIDNLEFRILAYCPGEYLIKMEQWFLNQFSNKFNIRIIAESNYGLKFSNDTKKKMSDKRKGIAVRGFNFIVSDETKEKMRIAGKNKIFSEDHKNNLKIAAKKRSAIISILKKGEGNHSAKLNWEKVEIIRSSKLSAIELANKFNVNISSIYNIKNNKTWLV